MTNLDKIAFIRQKAIEANKFIAHRPFQDVRLADVLLALRSTFEQVYVDSSGELYQNGNTEPSKERSGHFWNLREDNLEDQTPETIDFLYSLLK